MSRKASDVYEPAEDTELLLQAMKDLALAGRRVLEVGPGSGVVVETALRFGAEVAAVDLNPHACTATYARIGGYVARGDLATCVRGRFDIVLFNAPYLPSSEEERVEGWLDHAFHGGERGIETTIRLLRDLPRILADRGVALIVVSSRADLDALATEVARIGLRHEKVRSQRFFFEEIAVWSLSRQP